MKSYRHRQISSIAKPPILETIERSGVVLRKVGKEFIGLCPFHPDKHPSFSVSEEKQVYHCFSCGSSGDVISFIQRRYGLSFTEARRALGICTPIAAHGSAQPPRKPRRSEALLIEARRLAAWANEMTLRAGCLLRQIGQQIRLASAIPDTELVQSFERAWALLEMLAEDLQNPNHLIELYRSRDIIENILADAVDDWIAPEFPPLTRSYLEFLRNHLPTEPPREAPKHG